MEFNVSKCKMMHHGKDNAGYSYNMDKQQASKQVESERGLGVIFYQDLKSLVHCTEASKANRIMLGLMRMTSKYRNPVTDKSLQVVG